MPKNSYRTPIVEAPRQLSLLAEALDAESLQWLNDNLPNLAEALEIEVSLGSTPGDLRRFVMSYTGRDELARRIEQASRAILHRVEAA